MKFNRFVLGLLVLLPVCLEAFKLSTEKIAYCDLERVFEEAPLTQVSRKLLELEMMKMEKAISQLDEEIRGLELKRETEREAVITVPQVEPPAPSAPGEYGTAFSTYQVTTGTAAPSQVSDLLSEPLMKEELPGVSLADEIEKKKRELGDKKNRFKLELRTKEEELREQILGRLYNIIEEIAQENQYTVILDKSNVLYSSGTEDITDEVARRLKQLME